jgi:tRNA A37 threonylcarbamoyladenosine dehydratase
MPSVNFRERLAAAERDRSEYRPTLIDARAADAGARLGELFAKEQIATVTDTLFDQLEELFTVRAPAQKDAAERAAAHLGGSDPLEYGVWVHYPWSRRLVHVLPADEFHEVRTSRNRYKITPDEQRRLASAAIGIVGLSAGHAIATTLALERTAGEFRLADFDLISLSNLNRVVSSVGELGINKAVLAARRIFEIDPFSKITVFPEGLSEENFDRFFDEGGRLDLVIEECDDLYTKAKVRELARSRRIPVIMETNDRGLLDVERFDLEPSRPIFHGRLASAGAEALKHLDNRRKVPFALAIGDYERISVRGAATMAEIGRTTVGWAQLGSGTTLGGAAVTDAARRILLGELRRSGRYYVDLEALIGDEATDHSTDPPAELRVSRPPRPRTATRPRPPPEIANILAAGCAAPSGGNCQPWRFIVHGGRTIEVEHDPSRSRSMLDFDDRAAHLAIGAAVENLVLAAGLSGHAASVTPFPPSSEAVALVKLEKSEGLAPDPLASFIFSRGTNRRLGPRTPLEGSSRTALIDAAAASSATLLVIDEPRELEAAGSVLGAMDRVRFFSETLHREMMAELRFTREEAEKWGDGIDLATLEMAASDRAALRMLHRWPLVNFLKRIGGGSILEESSKRAVASASALCLLMRPGADRLSYFLGGRALQRVWLTATSLELAVQPMSACVYLFARLEHGSGFTEDERAIISRERQRFLEIFPVPAGFGEMLLFRVAKAAPPSARSVRRRLESSSRVAD